MNLINILKISSKLVDTCLWVGMNDKSPVYRLWLPLYPDFKKLMLNIFSCNLFSIARATNLCYFSFGLGSYTLYLSKFLLDCSLSNVVISVTANWRQKLIRRSWSGRLRCLDFKSQIKILYITKPFLFVVWWFGFFKNWLDYFQVFVGSQRLLRFFEPATWKD